MPTMCTQRLTQFTVVPSFNSTSRAELDDLLLSWREKVFVPAALQEHHRRLVYKPSRHQTLTNDPGVTVTMDDDEEIKLQPANFYDKPNKRESIRELLHELGSTNEDAAWNNLAPFLTGLRMSKYDLPIYFYEKVTRKACEVGKERIILTCAERAEETGFTLKKKGVARELMLGLHTRAAQHKFTGPELESAARRAEKIVRMLENELHGAERLQQDEEDPRKDALVISVLAEIAAAKALNAEGSVDHAANYATKMLHLSNEAANVGYAREVPARGKEDVRVRAEKNSELETLIPLQNAVKMALSLDSIQKSPLGKDLATHRKTIDAKVKEALQKLSTLSDGKSRRGQLMYEELQEGTKKEGT